MGTRGGPTTAPVCVYSDPHVHQVPIGTYAFFVVPRPATIVTHIGPPLDIYIAFLVNMSYVIYAPRGPFGHFTPRSSVLTHTGTPVIDAHSPPCAYVANNDLFPYDPNVSIRLPIKVFSLLYNQPIESIHLDQSHAAPNGYTIAHSPNTKNNTRSKTPIVELF
jgi:hypothetical protein